MFKAAAADVLGAVALSYQKEVLKGKINFFAFYHGTHLLLPLSVLPFCDACVEVLLKLCVLFNSLLCERVTFNKVKSVDCGSRSLRPHDQRVSPNGNASILRMGNWHRGTKFLLSFKSLLDLLDLLRKEFVDLFGGFLLDIFHNCWSTG